MGAYFHHVGPTHREAKPRKTWDQMGGLLQEPSWTPVVQNSQEPRRMEIATVCQYRRRSLKVPPVSRDGIPEKSRALSSLPAPDARANSSRDVIHLSLLFHRATSLNVPWSLCDLLSCTLVVSSILTSLSQYVTENYKKYVRTSVTCGYHGEGQGPKMTQNIKLFFFS
ncbi:hypothetical protein ANN_20655 [Periplaneta americana]|uniref:Uncharacterized protein n=1 Tax=Periplaneta americana TaxID=6978 RepID=A0ABQ8SD63_PERAM|nr:hypothetical protein ANN_20655 [Periplaneta americana]